MFDKKKVIIISIAIITALIAVILILKPNSNIEKREYTQKIEPTQSESIEIEEPAKEIESESTEVTAETIKKESIKEIQSAKNISKQVKKLQPKPETIINKTVLPQKEEQKTLTLGIEEDKTLEDVYVDEDGSIVVNKLFAFKSKARYLFK